MAVPEWLEKGVGKTQGQNILNRFFAKIMVDSEDLVFVEHARQLMIQFPRCVEAATEWFLDDDPL